ncbi:UNVERIFIED_CONTAM: hypothetical protein FKN15_054981 [Acipenser sinensis]
MFLSMLLLAVLLPELPSDRTINTTLINEAASGPLKPRGQQAFRIQPDNVTLVEGGTGVLQCHVEGVTGAVQWVKDGLLLGPNRSMPGFPRYSMAGDEGKGEFNLQIERVTLEDDSPYECQVGQSESSIGIISHTVWVTVLIPPGKPVIEEHSGVSEVEWVAGVEYTVSCSVTDTKPASELKFTKREQPPRKGIKTKTHPGQLEAARDWKMLADVGQQLIFPPEIATTNLRPDIVLWSGLANPVHLVELTVPWEDAVDEVYEMKKLWYAQLATEAEQRGWRVQVYPLEVGCRGFVAHSTTRFLRDIGFSGQESQRIVLVELTVPWEDAVDEVYEMKKLWYAQLATEAEQRGWRVQVYPLEVGCRGFVAHSTTWFLRDIGFSGQESQRIVEMKGFWLGTSSIVERKQHRCKGRGVDILESDINK